MENYINEWKKSLDYSSRSSRKEFWVFHVITLGVLMTLWLLALLLFIVNLDGLAFISLILAGALSIGVMVPSLSLFVRRLHDINLSGWLMLLGLIPFIGGFILLVFALLPSSLGVNKYDKNSFGEGIGSNVHHSSVTGAL